MTDTDKPEAFQDVRPLPPAPVMAVEKTLRDYFAAAALPHVMNPDNLKYQTTETKARAAYAWADAMLAARQGGGTDGK